VDFPAFGGPRARPGSPRARSPRGAASAADLAARLAISRERPEARDIGLVLEVEHRLELRRQRQQPLAPASTRRDSAPPAEPIAARAGSRSRLRAGRRALGFGEVDAPVGEGAAGEFARLGAAQPGSAASAASTAATTARPPWRCSSARSSPVAVRARETTAPARRRAAARGIAQRGRLAGAAAAAAAERLERRAAPRPAHPDDRDPRGRRAAREREDRVHGPALSVRRRAASPPAFARLARAFHEVLEHLQPHLPHRRELLGVFLQLLGVARALHRLGEGVDIDRVGLPRRRAGP
jgi:hypothetical protein